MLYINPTHLYMSYLEQEWFPVSGGGIEVVWNIEMLLLTKLLQR